MGVVGSCLRGLTGILAAEFWTYWSLCGLSLGIPMRSALQKSSLEEMDQLFDILEGENGVKFGDVEVIEGLAEVVDMGFKGELGD